jgi:hypothetical protein
MTDYTSPIPRRRDLYSTLFNENVTSPPPADNALRDTTVNVATAFSNAEQQQQQQQQPYSIATRSPSRSLSGVGTGPHIDTSYLMSPSKRFPMTRRDTDQYGTLVDSDNDFFGKGYLRGREQRKCRRLTTLRSSLRIQTDGGLWTTILVFLTTKL